MDGVSVSLWVTESSRETAGAGLLPKRIRSPGEPGALACMLDAVVPGLTGQSSGMLTRMPPGPGTCRNPGGTAPGFSEDKGGGASADGDVAAGDAGAGDADAGDADAGDADAVVGEGVLAAAACAMVDAAAALGSPAPPRSAGIIVTAVTSANAVHAATIAATSPLSRLGGAVGGGDSDGKGGTDCGGAAPTSARRSHNGTPGAGSAGSSIPQPFDAGGGRCSGCGRAPPETRPSPDNRP